jgi:hypothetical protein
MVVAFLLMVSAGVCAELSFKSDDDFGKWMTFYYQNPSPDRIPSALVYFCNSPIYKSNAVMPAAAFFSALFKKDAALMQKIFDDVLLKGTDNTKIMLINILSLVNNTESKALLGKAQNSWQSEQLQGIIARRIAHPHDDLYSISVKSPQVLDMLWASFFATGDPIPVQKIISVLHLQKDGHGEEIMVGGAANWSLKSNAEQHPKVLEICKNEFASAQGITKQMLAEVIKQ